MFIFFTRIALFLCSNIYLISFLISSFNIWISNTKNTEKKREKNNQDSIESQEDSEIIDNVFKHVYNWTQRTEDSKEHESLVKADQQNEHHHKFASNDERSFKSLNNNIDNRNNNIQNIKPVLDIIKVSASVSKDLFELIISWIDQTNQDWNEEESLELQVFVIQNVSNVDVNN